ncbi:MAG: biopolymer transporter ExbD [Deltaproteobacteria bacterium]|nr:biopolymer transporter ExbD [Deltaproteobacteria bacterium]
MGWKLTNNRERMMSEINITPLTDVMLVLLVIFMVTTPLIMTESFKIRLPKAVSSDAEPGKGTVIAVSEAGRLSLNGRDIKEEELLQELKKDFLNASDRTVVVKADGGVRHGVIVKVLDTAKLAGAVKLSIATQKDRD